MIHGTKRFLVGSTSILTVLSAVIVSSATAPTGRYTTSTGTVYDTKTGLTWQQPISTQLVNNANAPTYCASLGSGWRVPTLKELVTIVDYTVAPPGPMVDNTAFPQTPTDQEYLSMTAFATSGSWVIDFGSATICDNCGSNGNSFYVRCVR